MQWKVLKLNAAYIPIDVVHWTDAMVAICNGKCEVVEVYDGEFLHYGFDRETNSPKGSMPVPAVIRTKKFNAPKGNKKFLKPYGRYNVWIRDGKTCQYCGKPITFKEMECEHVHPQSKNGETSWTNIVAACRKCNSKKADKSCEEIGMFPMTKPYAPVIADGYIGGMIDRVKYKIGDIDKLDNHVWNNYIHMLKKGNDKCS